jgi:mannosyl-3-phosphoglycerate phosphatase
VRLVRGNRFLHLQGCHDKADVVEMILQLLGERPGTVVALGDAPNDAGLLAAADLAVVIPSIQGPHPGLTARFPGALVAPRPHGLGWADVVGAMLEARET